MRPIDTLTCCAITCTLALSGCWTPEPWSAVQPDHIGPSDGWDGGGAGSLPDPRAPDADLEFGASYAVLVENLSGASILLLDANTDITGRIELDMGWPSSLDWSPGGFFVVAQGDDFYRVELDGSIERVLEASDSVYRSVVDADGVITVAQEIQVVQYDRSGDPIFTASGSGCFVDVSLDGEGGLATIDMLGPSVSTWTPGSAPLSSLFGYDGTMSGLEILGRDGGGRLWVGDGDDDRVHVQQDGFWMAEDLGSLSARGFDVRGLLAIEPAGDDSVLALYSGESGEGLIWLDRGGAAALVRDAGEDIWIDLVRLD